MRPQNGDQTPERRKARAVLSVREPLIETLLAGLGVEGSDLDELRRFCKAWTSDRNRFDIKRRRTGLFGSNRLRLADADRALKLALAEMAEGGEQ